METAGLGAENIRQHSRVTRVAEDGHVEEGLPRRLSSLAPHLITKNKPCGNRHSRFSIIYAKAETTIGGGPYTIILHYIRRSEVA